MWVYKQVILSGVLPHTLIFPLPHGVVHRGPCKTKKEAISKEKAETTRFILRYYNNFKIS